MSFLLSFFYSFAGNGRSGRKSMAEMVSHIATRIVNEQCSVFYLIDKLVNLIRMWV